MARLDAALQTIIATLPQGNQHLEFAPVLSVGLGLLPCCKTIVTPAPFFWGPSSVVFGCQTRRCLAGMKEEQSVEMLQIELDRLRNSQQHLQRSNFELQEALNQEGPDPDFKQAIEVRIYTSMAALQLCKLAISLGDACA